MPQAFARGLPAALWCLLLFGAVTVAASSLMLPPFETTLGRPETGVLLALTLVCAILSAAILLVTRASRSAMTRPLKLLRGGSWALALGVVDFGLLLSLGGGLRGWSLAASCVGIGLLLAGAPRPTEFDLFGDR